MKKPEYKTKVSSRSDLLTLLTEACELEHGLACSYLYAAFSLKQDMDEGGVTAAQLHQVKKWAAQIYLVAAQEMFHLSQAWNLITALGGVPYYFRPNFPQSSKYYPIGLPLLLEPFGEASLSRFILYEYPQFMDEKHFLKGELGYRGEDLYDYKTVGELYGMIRQGLLDLSKSDCTYLFIGDKDLQLSCNEIDFPEIIQVIDLETALQAIDAITEQGEGRTEDHRDGHFHIFNQILDEFKSERDNAGSTFQPVRNVICNPVVHIKGDYREGRGDIITAPVSAELADIFDDLYNYMLRVLKYAFSAPLDKATRKALCQFSIAMMPMVIKPLGDSLMLLPAGRLYPGKSAGPAFSMSRHLSFPTAVPVAMITMSERLGEIGDRLNTLTDELPQIKAAASNLERLKNYLPL